MLNTLSSIGKELNSKNITWAVGASLLLSTYGFISKPNDIDIFIDIKDISEADRIIYQLIPNREYKVEMIEKYLLSNKINHPELLERSLLACLPKNVIERIKKLIL